MCGSATYFCKVSVSMNTFGILKVCGAISLILSSYVFIVKCNVIGEWEFQNLHLDLNKLHWKELDKLTHKDLERICLQVVDDEMTYMIAIEEYTVEEGDESNSTLISATIQRNSKVLFRHGIVMMSLIKCDDKRLTIYLAEGDSNHIFVLRANKDDVYTFTGSMQNVTYFLS